MASWVTTRSYKKREKTREHVERERRVGDTLAALLFAGGLFVLAFTVVHYIDIYFGDFDQWSVVADRSDDSSALFAFLSDISQGVGLGLALMGISWLTARSLLRTTSDDEYASVSTGQREVQEGKAAGRMTRP